MKRDYSHINGKDPKISAEVKIENGAPCLFIYGVKTDPLIFFGNTEAPGWFERDSISKEIKLAALNGVHIHSIVVHIPIVDDQTKQPDYSQFIQAMDYTIASDPMAIIIPRVAVPIRDLEWWQKNCSDGIAVYKDNSIGAPNIYADEWMNQAENSLVNMFQFIRSHEEYDKRIIGYHIFPVGIGEWMSKQGHVSGVDYSNACAQKFNQYLLEKYKSSENLQKAWGKQVEIGRVDIPVPPNNINFKEPYDKLFIDVNSDRNILDLYDFISDFNVQIIEELSEIIKRGTNGKSLVMQFYGYTFELGDPKTGHQSLTRLLGCPYVDMLCSPVGYVDRLEGGLMSFMSPVDTVHRAGKLWLVEDDTKTNLSPSETDNEFDPFNEKIKTLEDTLQIHKRNMAGVICRGAGIWWMDLWANGWLNSPEMWENINNLSKSYHIFGERFGFAHKPEVAIVADEDGIKSFYAPWDQAKSVLQQNMQTIYRSGVSFGLYLLDDVLNGAASDCKLYIIIGAYNVDPQKKDKILQVLHDKSKTVLWLYGADTAKQEYTKEITGFSTSLIDEMPHSTVVDLPFADELIYRNEIKPVYYIDDIDSECLANFVHNKSCAYAVKNFENWTSLYYGGLSLSIEAVRIAAKIAGVHIFEQENDIVIASNAMVSIYSRTSGEKQISLPFVSNVYDNTFNIIHKNVCVFKDTFKLYEEKTYFYEKA